MLPGVTERNLPVTSGPGGNTPFLSPPTCTSCSGWLTAASLLASWSFLFESVTSCTSREKGAHWEVAVNSLPVPDPESFSLASTESASANLYVLSLVMGCHVNVCVPWGYL